MDLLTLTFQGDERAVVGTTVVGPLTLTVEAAGFQQAVVKVEGTLTHRVEEVRKQVSAFVVDKICQLDQLLAALPLGSEQGQALLLRLRYLQQDLEGLEDVDGRGDFTVGVHLYATIVANRDVTFQVFHEPDLQFGLRLGGESHHGQVNVLELCVTDPQDLFQQLNRRFGQYTEVASAAMGVSNLSILNARSPHWRSVPNSSPTPQFKPADLYILFGQQTERYRINHEVTSLVTKNGRELYITWLLESGKFEICWHDEGYITRLVTEYRRAKAAFRGRQSESAKKVFVLQKVITTLEQEEQPDLERLAFLKQAIKNEKELLAADYRELEAVPLGEGSMESTLTIGFDKAVTTSLYDGNSIVPITLVIKDKDSDKDLPVPLQFLDILEANVALKLHCYHRNVELDASREIFTPIQMEEESLPRSPIKGLAKDKTKEKTKETEEKSKKSKKTKEKTKETKETEETEEKSKKSKKSKIPKFKVLKAFRSTKSTRSTRAHPYS
jgi:hypothetical protein